MLEVGQIVELENGKEYIVINEMELHNLKYVFLMSNSKPLDMVIGTLREVDGEAIISEVKDNDELDYILSKFVLTKEDSEFDE